MEIKRPPRAYGATEKDSDAFTAGVKEGQGRLKANSPVPQDVRRVRNIYHELYWDS